MKSSARASFDPSVFEWAHDLNGYQWNVVLNKALSPSSRRPDVLVWHVSMFAETSLDQSGLVDSGVFDQRRDARILGLLGKSCVKVRTAAVHFEVSSEKQIAQMASEAATGIRKVLLNQAVVGLKRRCVAEQVESLCRFGGAEKY